MARSLAKSDFFLNQPRSADVVTDKPSVIVQIPYLPEISIR